MTIRFLFAVTTAFLVATNVPCFGETLPAPRMVLEERAFDFGAVDEGSVLEHDFIVKNPGKKPLEIQKVSPG